MNVDPKLLESLNGIPWLQSCGADSVLSVEKYLRQVSSWAEADAVYDETWETIISHQKNAITTTLSRHYKADYQQWNQVMGQIRPEVQQRIGPWLQEAVGRAGIDVFYISVINADIDLYVMEMTYAQHGCVIPMFFRNLFNIYSAGHFPCGWGGGTFPDGYLLYY
jgi:hypothetical protein